MIGKVLAPHGDVSGTLRYVLGKKGAEVVPGGTLQGRDVAELCRTAKTLEATAGTSRKHLVFHGVLALHPDESLTNQRWSQVAQQFMDGLGYRDAPWCVVRHHDTDHSHVHIVGLRVDAAGKHVPDSFERERSRKVVDGIERDFGLRRLPAKAPRRAPPPKEIWEARRSGGSVDALPRHQIWRALDASLEGRPATLPALMRSLEAQGVRVVPNVSRTTERVSGLRYVHLPSSRSFTATQLGPDAKLDGLASRGVAVGELPLLRGAQAHHRGASGDPEASAVWASYLKTGAPAVDPKVAAEQIRVVVAEVVRTKPSMTGFLEQLEAQGVWVRPNVSVTTGRVSGLTYAVEGASFKASALGKMMGFPALRLRGVEYAPERDLPALLARRGGRPREDAGDRDGARPVSPTVGPAWGAPSEPGAAADVLGQGEGIAARGEAGGAGGVAARGSAGGSPEVARAQDEGPEAADSGPSVGRDDPALAEALARYHHHRDRVERLALLDGRGGDADQVDLQVSRRLQREGWSVEQVAGVLEAGSPGLASRHPDPAAYAQETASRVFAAEASRRSRSGPDIDR